MAKETLPRKLNKENLYSLFDFLGPSHLKNKTDRNHFSVIECKESFWPNYVYKVNWSSPEYLQNLHLIAEEIQRNHLPNQLLVDFYSPKLRIDLDQLGFRLLEQWYAVSRLKSNRTKLYHKAIEADIFIDRVSNERMLEEWAHIVASGWWGRIDESVAFLHDLFFPYAGKKKAGIELFNLYLDEIPAACLFTYKSPKALGLYFPVTLEEFRQEGLAKRLIDHVIRRSLRKWPSSPIVAQATELGKKLYQGLKFKIDFQYRIYVLKKPLDLNESL